MIWTDDIIYLFYLSLMVSWDNWRHMDVLQDKRKKIERKERRNRDGKISNEEKTKGRGAQRNLSFFLSLSFFLFLSAFHPFPSPSLSSLITTAKQVSAGNGYWRLDMRRCLAGNLCI